MILLFHSLLFTVVVHAIQEKPNDDTDHNWPVNTKSRFRGKFCLDLEGKNYAFGQKLRHICDQFTCTYFWRGFSKWIKKSLPSACCFIQEKGFQNNIEISNFMSDNIGLSSKLVCRVIDGTPILVQETLQSCCMVDGHLYQPGSVIMSTECLEARCISTSQGPIIQLTNL